MVFIKTQKYIDTFNKSSRNIVSLEGVLTYKCYENECQSFTFVINQGDIETFLFTIDTEDQGIQVMKNILQYHKANDAFEIIDIDQFIITDKPNHTMSFEEVHDTMLELLELHGYSKLVQIYEDMVMEINQNPNEINNENIILIDKTKIEPNNIPITTNSLHLNNVNNSIHYQ
jgi:hypothetical protein